MMYVDATTLDPAETYRLLVGSVVPRPIAWVTSGSEEGATNLAPFSSFAWVSQHPAMLGFTVNRRPTGRKDTIENIERDGEYVINVATEELLQEMHDSSEWLAPGDSEVKAQGLDLAPSTRVRVPRLARAMVSMEMVHERTIAFSPTGGEFVVGRVVAWHIDDSVMVNGRIDSDLLKPVGRLAGPRYSKLTEVIELAPVPGGAPTGA
jgi:flavin reductase (DIM6/NTAB) family NADH-FMN oxidoreductase RutF